MWRGGRRGEDISVRRGQEGDLMKRAGLLVVTLLLGGCVSRGAYRSQGEALARSLDLNRKSIETVKRLEEENGKYRKIYGDSVRIAKEAELRMKGGQLK